MLLGGTCCSRALDQGSVGRGMLGWEEGGFVGRGDCREGVLVRGVCVCHRHLLRAAPGLRYV